MPDITTTDRDASGLGEPADLAIGAEVPEADAVEQAQELRVSGGTGVSIGDEVPEADALEQAHPVELDEDDYR